MKKRYIIALIITILILWLTSPYWLNFKAKYHAHFEFYIFTIILICGYLFSFKLTEYLANFKNFKNYSRIDIVFLLVFFLLLFIPMSHINYNATKSYTENRELAVYKPLFLPDYKINYNFGDDFNAWFNDRFAFRNNLIYFYNYLVYKIAYKYVKYPNGCINKSNKFLYKYWYIKGSKTSNLGKSLKALRNFNKFCLNNNIKLYVLVVPTKELIYNPSNSIKRTDNNFVKHIKKYNDTNIIYPADELIEASKKDYIYYKTEHHWTDYGAFTGYKELMKSISRDFNDVKILNENDFNYEYNHLVNADFGEEFGRGQTCSYLGLPDILCRKSLDVKYKYFIHKNEKSLNKIILDGKKKYYYPYGSNHRVILIGTSMGEALSKILPYSFKNTYRIRINTKDKKQTEIFKIIKYHKKEILNYKPDILILCITYTNFNKLKNLFKE